MNRNKTAVFFFLLKLLGLFAAVLTLYAPLTIELMLIGQISPERAAWLLLPAEAAAFLVFFARLAMEKRKKLPTAAGKLLRILLIFFLSAGAAWIFRAEVFYAIGAFLVVFASSIFGERLARLPYGAVSSIPFLVLSTVLGLISAMIVSFSGYASQHHMFLLTLFLFLFIAVWLLCGNQANIDQVMERRGHRLDLLPPRVRRHSLILIAVLFAVVFALFSFREPLGAVLWEVLRAVVLAVFWVLQLLGRLLGRLFSVDEPDERVPSSQGALPTGEGSSGINFFYLLIAALVVLLVVKHRQILRFLREQLARLARWISRLMNTQAARHKESGETGYTDSVETLVPEQAEKRKAERASLRAWKKEYRAYLKMERDEARLREGYRLLRKKLTLAGIPAPESDTPAELLCRTHALFQEEGYPQALEGYMWVRYAEQSATENGLTAMDQALLAKLPERSKHI